jgi:hypothetical protein
MGMQWQRVRLVAALGSVVLALAMAPVAAAHPVVARIALRQPEENQKVVLPDTSIAAPALWSEAVTPYSNPAAVLAWVGTDPNHSLNVETSSDGLHYGNKHTFSDDSDLAPAVTVVGGKIIIAWVGLDPHHSLNVVYDALGSYQKLTMLDNSDAPPALTFFNGDVYLAWRGTDPQHLLNIRDMGPARNRIVVGKAVTLTNYYSLAGIGLAPDQAHHQLLLTWTDTGLSPYLPNDAQYINYLASSDAVHWHTVLVAPPPQTSVAGPSMMALHPVPNNTEPYYWAWTGTDADHSLNLATSSVYNSYLAPITTFSEECDGSPALGYADVLVNHILIAWTGTDAAHHLNIGEFSV